VIGARKPRLHFTTAAHGDSVFFFFVSAEYCILKEEFVLTRGVSYISRFTYAGDERLDASATMTR
jgi:hypothetical protein